MRSGRMRVFVDIDKIVEEWSDVCHTSVIGRLLSSNDELEAVDPLAEGASDAHDAVSSGRNQGVTGMIISSRSA